MTRSSIVLLLFVALGCRRPAPPSDAQVGLVPSASYVSDVDGGWESRSISVSVDQQPPGARSVLAVSAARITRDGSKERFTLPSLACPNTVVAGCAVTNCSSLRGVTFYPYGRIDPSSPGVVQFEASGSSRYELHSDAGARLEPVMRAAPLFAPGSAVEVVATGGDAPSFRRAISIPRPVQLLKPLATETGVSMRLTRLVPLEVRWSPLPEKSPERLAVAVSDNVRTATCRFDSAAGVGLVPLEVMAMLAPGPGFLTVHTVWARETAVDGWLLSTQARQVALGADGGSAAFPTLEFD